MLGRAHSGSHLRVQQGPDDPSRLTFRRQAYRSAGVRKETDYIDQQNSDAMSGGVTIQEGLGLLSYFFSGTQLEDCQAADPALTARPFPPLIGPRDSIPVSSPWRAPTSRGVSSTSVAALLSASRHVQPRNSAEENAEALSLRCRSVLPAPSLALPPKHV